MTFTAAEVQFLNRLERGHLATVAPTGSPQVKPVGFSYNVDLDTVDISGVNMARSAKYRNVQTSPSVSFVVDEVTAPNMEGAHFLEIRGIAERATGPEDPTGHLAPEIIRIHPRRIISFNVDPDSPGFSARDVAPERDEEVA